MAIERALCPVLIGRDEQLSLLEDALLAAHRGEGQMVVLAGEAGMGKTRLASELQKRALKAGTTVMWGGCSEADLALPYLPFLEAVGNYLATADLARLGEQLGPARRELANLFPQLAADGLARDDSPSTQAKLRLFEAVLTLLRVPAAEHGLLLVAEDLHWSDASTRELLDYLARRLRSARIMVLATYRKDELHRKHVLLPMVQGWRRAGMATMVELQPLPPERVGDMVAAIFDEPTRDDTRDFLHARTDGNPFVLEELLKLALDRGDIYRTPTGWTRKKISELRLPDSVRDTILLRVERLTPEQAGLLRTAAVLGPSFTYGTLVAVSNADRDLVKAALHAFIQQQLMEEELHADGRYRFRHALTREAIYEDLIAPDRAELHARAAEVLREQPDTAPADLAYHLLAARRWQEAVPVALQAAAAAEARLGYREAAELYERVLPHLEDRPTMGRVLCRLGNAFFLAADYNRAQSYLEKGIPVLEECKLGGEAAHHRLALGRCYWERSRHDLAEAEYERVRATLEPEGPSEDLAYAYVRLAGQRAFAFDHQHALDLARRALTIAEGARAEVPRILANIYVGGALMGLGSVEEGFAHLDRSYREALNGGHFWIAATALGNYAAASYYAFRAGEALPRMALLRALPPSPRRDYMAGLYEGVIYRCLGEPRKARTLLEEGLAAAQQADASTAVTRIRQNLAGVYGMLGEFAAAFPLVPGRETRLEAQEAFGRLYTIVTLHLDAGDIRSAIEEIRAQEHLMGSAPVYVKRFVFSGAVEALIAGGEVDQAEQLVTEMRGAGPDVSPRLAYMEGRVALARGEPAAAQAHLEAAAKVFHRISYRWDEARTRRALAEAKAHQGDRAGAEAELRKVIAYADEYGAVFEGRAARQQLAALGIDVDAPKGEAPRVREPIQASERLVSVLFVDVRGYTALTAQQAPHSTADQIATFQRWAKQEIQRHHGLVDKFAGDAVMATFNVVGMRLDHCLHALQAALAIRDKAAYEGLAVGAGIAVGPAVVGQLTEGANVTVLGEATNLAARLQAAAGGGEVLLSEEAFRRTREWLQAQKLDPAKETLTLKGFAVPVQAHRLPAS